MAASPLAAAAVDLTTPSAPPARAGIGDRSGDNFAARDDRIALQRPARKKKEKKLRARAGAGSMQSCTRCSAALRVQVGAAVRIETRRDGNVELATVAVSAAARAAMCQQSAALQRSRGRAALRCRAALDAAARSRCGWTGHGDARSPMRGETRERRPVASAPGRARTAWSAAQHRSAAQQRMGF